MFWWHGIATAYRQAKALIPANICELSAQIINKRDIRKLKDQFGISTFKTILFLYLLGARFESFIHITPEDINYSPEKIDVRIRMCKTWTTDFKGTVPIRCNCDKDNGTEFCLFHEPTLQKVPIILPVNPGRLANALQYMNGSLNSPRVSSATALRLLFHSLKICCKSFKDAPGEIFLWESGSKMWFRYSQGWYRRYLDEMIPVNSMYRALDITQGQIANPKTRKRNKVPALGEIERKEIEKYLDLEASVEESIKFRKDKRAKRKDEAFYSAGSSDESDDSNNERPAKRAKSEPSLVSQKNLDTLRLLAPECPQLNELLQFFIK